MQGSRLSRRRYSCSFQRGGIAGSADTVRDTWGFVTKFCTEDGNFDLVGTFAFELGKCYETAIWERMLAVLANVDPDLCAGVATGLGLPAPEPTDKLPDVAPSPALSQVGQHWPVTGRRSVPPCQSDRRLG
ncbi:MAG: catalase-related domain-containing protein [Pseudonocardiaceae bacterium]